MAKQTTIGWTHHTWNPWMGCNKVSEECRYCYISGIIKRMGKEPFKGPMRTTSTWAEPPKWDRAAERDGVRRRVFTCSISDFFHAGADRWRGDAWGLIRQCRNLDWLVLTKRAERIAPHLPDDWGNGYGNVWLGVTVGCRDSMHRLDYLRDVPARTKFVSAEPLLERIDLRPHLGWLDWVITGCERAAKHNRRLMNMEWVREIDRHCNTAGVSHFFKQAYIGNKGVPCERPKLGKAVRQKWPA